MLAWWPTGTATEFCRERKTRWGERATFGEREERRKHLLPSLPSPERMIDGCLLPVFSVFSPSVPRFLLRLCFFSCRSSLFRKASPLLYFLVSPVPPLFPSSFKVFFSFQLRLPLVSKLSLSVIFSPPNFHQFSPSFCFVLSCLFIGE